jgi:DNA-binding beta-propeller fold protein YncE
VRPGPTLALAILLCCSACEGGGTGASAATDGSEESAGSTGASAARLVVTADWREGKLSLLDFDALAAGAATREEALVGEVDLSAYAPGPLELEITPDGRTAVVAVSPGFFDGLVGQTLGFGEIALDGTLLVVDLETRSVTAEIATAHVPMGIAIAPDGSRAYTANFGHTDAHGSTMSVIELASATVLEEVEVGGGPEQVALDASGTLGIVNVDELDAVRVFATADPGGTLSPPLVVAGDPSGVAFVAGTSLAVVADSLDPATWTVIDASDPAAPTVVEEAAPPGGFPYGVTPIAGTTDVLLTVANDSIEVLRIDAAATPSAIEWNLIVTGVRAFPLGVAIDPAANIGFMGAPGAGALVVLSLDGATSRTIAFPGDGPTYVAIQPG